jgi:hypothetical protein
MADEPSRASIAMHYTIMATLVVWVVGLGFYVFF